MSGVLERPSADQRGLQTVGRAEHRAAPRAAVAAPAAQPGRSAWAACSLPLDAVGRLSPGAKPQSTYLLQVGSKAERVAACELASVWSWLGCAAGRAGSKIVLGALEGSAEATAARYAREEPVLAQQLQRLASKQQLVELLGELRASGALGRLGERALAAGYSAVRSSPSRPTAAAAPSPLRWGARRPRSHFAAGDEASAGSGQAAAPAAAAGRPAVPSPPQQQLPQNGRSQQQQQQQQNGYLQQRKQQPSPAPAPAAPLAPPLGSPASPPSPFPVCYALPCDGCGLPLPAGVAVPGAASKPVHLLSVSTWGEMLVARELAMVWRQLHCSPSSSDADTYVQQAVLGRYERWLPRLVQRLRGRASLPLLASLLEELSKSGELLELANGAVGAAAAADAAAEAADAAAAALEGAVGRSASQPATPPCQSGGGSQPAGTAPAGWGSGQLQRQQGAGRAGPWAQPSQQQRPQQEQQVTAAQRNGSWPGRPPLQRQQRPLKRQQQEEEEEEEEEQQQQQVQGHPDEEEGALEVLLGLGLGSGAGAGGGGPSPAPRPARKRATSTAAAAEDAGAEVAEPARKKRKKQPSLRFSVPGRACAGCGATATPQWRRFNDLLLCNACGVREKKRWEKRRYGKTGWAIPPHPRRSLDGSPLGQVPAAAEASSATATSAEEPGASSMIAEGWAPAAIPQQQQQEQQQHSLDAVQPAARATAPAASSRQAGSQAAEEAAAAAAQPRSRVKAEPESAAEAAPARSSLAVARLGWLLALRLLGPTLPMAVLGTTALLAGFPRPQATAAASVQAGPGPLEPAPGVNQDAQEAAAGPAVQRTAGAGAKAVSSAAAGVSSSGEAGVKQEPAAAVQPAEVPSGPALVGSPHKRLAPAAEDQQPPKQEGGQAHQAAESGDAHPKPQGQQKASASQGPDQQGAAGQAVSTQRRMRRRQQSSAGSQEQARQQVTSSQGRAQGPQLRQGGGSTAAQCPQQEPQGQAGANGTLERPEGWLVGSAVCKRFDGVPYQGKVLRYNPRSKWYFVLYCDRDCEELDEAEVLGILAPSGLQRGEPAAAALSGANLSRRAPSTASSGDGTGGGGGEGSWGSRRSKRSLAAQP